MMKGSCTQKRNCIRRNKHNTSPVMKESKKTSQPEITEFHVIYLDKQVLEAEGWLYKCQLNK